jgi:hypothetical protein
MRAWWNEKLALGYEWATILLTWATATVLILAGWTILGWAVVAVAVFLTVLYAWGQR